MLEGNGEEAMVRDVVLERLREGGAGVSRLPGRMAGRRGRRSRRRVAAAPAEQETVGGCIAVSRLCGSGVALGAMAFFANSLS